MSSATMPSVSDHQAPELYVELLKRAILGDLAPHVPLVPVGGSSIPKQLFIGANRLIGITPAKREMADPVAKREGRSFPSNADSMIGHARMDNVCECARSVLREDVPGDFIETGVWRGGAAILMRGILAAYGDRERKVWVADSFQGVPPPSPEYPADADYVFHEWDVLTVTKDEVQANFHRYGLLDDRVVFLEGWFKDTLPSLTNTWSLVRLDGDLYESTMDAISPLYPNLSPGGFLVVDDYFDIDGCRAAITDYRAAHGITEPIRRIDWTGAYWQRER